MKWKSETFEKFKEFRAEVENQLGKCIMAIWFDRGGKYLLGDLKDYLVENEIISQLTALGTPKQNGVAKGRNKTFVDMVRSMLCAWVGPELYAKTKCFVSDSFDSISKAHESKEGHL